MLDFEETLRILEPHFVHVDGEDQAQFMLTNYLRFVLFSYGAFGVTGHHEKGRLHGRSRYPASNEILLAADFQLRRNIQRRRGVHRRDAQMSCTDSK